MPKKGKKIKPETPAPAEPKQAISLIKAPSPVSIRYMWIGVGIFSAIIFTLWGWSLKMQLASVKWQNAPEQNFINQNKNSWNKIFTNDKKDQNKLNQQTQQLKNIINYIAAKKGATSTEKSL